MAVVAEVVGLPLLVLGLISTATAVALLWYFWPAWVPRRWPRLPEWLRHRRRRSKKSDSAQLSDDQAPVDITDDDQTQDQLPALTSAMFSTRADQLSAQGRYAEAVRERLRGMVRTLVDHQVINHNPGWTVTELATAAAATNPRLDPPLSEACDIFSELWYGQRPAARDHDDRMRQLAVATTGALQPGPDGQPVGARPPAAALQAGPW